MHPLHCIDTNDENICIDQVLKIKTNIDKHVFLILPYSCFKPPLKIWRYGYLPPLVGITNVSHPGSHGGIPQLTHMSLCFTHLLTYPVPASQGRVELPPGLAWLTPRFVLFDV